MFCINVFNFCIRFFNKINQKPRVKINVAFFASQCCASIILKLFLEGRTYRFTIFRCDRIETQLHFAFNSFLLILFKNKQKILKNKLTKMNKDPRFNIFLLLIYKKKIMIFNK